jgi:hypothetical protein
VQCRQLHHDADQAYTDTHHVLAICPVQGQHGQDDTRLALPHVELHHSPWVVHQGLSDAILQGPDLQPPLHLKHQPARVEGHVPGALNRQLLEQGVQAHGKNTSARTAVSNWALHSQQQHEQQ